MVEEPIDAGRISVALVGKGDGQDGVRGDAFFADQPGDAACDDPGLAGAGSGEDEQGPSVASTAARCSGFRLSISGGKMCVQAGRVCNLVYRCGSTEFPWQHAILKTQ